MDCLCFPFEDLKNTHGALFLALPAPVAEDTIDIDFHLDGRRWNAKQSVHPREYYSICP
jgi:hypothetical protein